ncbi:MAG TPA: hypothetical protein VFJ82_01980 [Longimicrobium sp.]|nr:hypothetical protein [Longimicrobium sp.]
MRGVWRLPGPRHFLRRAADDLLDGRSLVMLLPGQGEAAGGLREGLTELWHLEETGAVEVLWAETDRTPERILAECLGAPPGERLTPVIFAAAAGETPGRVLWIEGVEASVWPAWRTFLLEFQRAALTVPAYARNRLVVTLEGAAAATAETPPAEVGLATHRWDDVLDTQDALLLAAQLLRERNTLRPALRPLLAAAIAQVALFDLDLVDRLAGEPVERILDPAPVLASLMHERGWQAGQQPTWADGSGAHVEGRFRPHAALDVRGDGVTERLWRAQVSVVFPAIEEHRQDMVRRLAPHLRLPFHTEFGRVDNAHDLEIGHLYRQVCIHDLPLPAAERNRLGDFRKARNALAHGETLDSTLILTLIQ